MLLLKITSEALAEDVRCRQALLAALSDFLGCETLAVSVGDDNVSLGKALTCLAKVSLPALLHIFQDFLKARIALRKEALKGCDLTSHSLSGSFLEFTLFGEALRGGRGGSRAF